MNFHGKSARYAKKLSEMKNDGPRYLGEFYCKAIEDISKEIYQKMRDRENAWLRHCVLACVPPAIKRHVESRHPDQLSVFVMNYIWKRADLVTIEDPGKDTHGYKAFFWEKKLIGSLPPIEFVTRLNDGVNAASKPFFYQPL